MRKILFKSLFIGLGFLTVQTATGQCTLNVSSTATNITCGQCVDMSAIALASTPLLVTDFNAGGRDTHAAFIIVQGNGGPRVHLPLLMLKISVVLVIPWFVTPPMIMIASGVPSSD